MDAAARNRRQDASRYCSGVAISEPPAPESEPGVFIIVNLCGYGTAMSSIKIAHQATETIDGDECSVQVVKIGATTWRAYGDFRGQHIDQTGRSDSQALNAWRRIANYIATE